MCQFLSAIVTRTGDVLCNPLFDSHSHLMKLFDVREDNKQEASAQNFIRIEYTPKPDANGLLQYLDFDSYSLRVDEHATPAWFDEDTKARTIAELRRRLESMLVTDDKRPILAGGAWMVGPGAKVEWLVGGRVLCVHKDADLSSANLSSANLSYANLRYANLSYANLRYADLSYANLSSANLRYADLSSAYRGSSQPPEGWKVNASGLLELDKTVTTSAPPAATTAVPKKTTKKKAAKKKRKTKK